LASSSRGAGWIIPGGKVEQEEVDREEEAAAREAREEAGVLGRKLYRWYVFKCYFYFSGQMGRCLGVFENKEMGHRTKVFVLYVGSLETEEIWEESCRARGWFRIDKAMEVLRENKPSHAKYLEKLIQTKNHLNLII
jgi:8-oxo-dGTP pyrophosphatase MutT (NUDIX family)